MHNVECKLELRDAAIARAAILRLGGAHVGTLQQTDTYFRVPTGRLKKRETLGEPEQWIRYDRVNRLEPRLSHFDLFDERTAIERFGSRPLPVLCVVRKTRELYTADHVRVHLDEVEGLGRFIEFEALVSRTNNVVKCHAAVRRLREAMAPALGEPISLSYSDMIQTQD